MMKKKRERKVGRKSECNLEDRISELPDEVLGSIVSLLTLIEAAASSTLSRRWQHIWTRTMNLNFDADYILDNFYTKNPSNIGKFERLKYLRWVNSVVEKHRGPKIDQFKVCFERESEADSDIDDWVMFAMKKRVQKLELDFLTFCATWVILTTYSFPERHVSSNYIGFESLQVLDFKCVNVSGAVLEGLLLNCPFLERLIVWRSLDLFYLRVSGKSLSLKHLEIQNCEHLESIEVSSPNLVSFYIDGFHLQSFLLENVPKLVEVSIPWLPNENNIENDAFNLLSGCLSQLEILKLDIDEHTDAQVIPMLRNLKHLQLIASNYYSGFLLQLSAFMTAFPYLQRLVLAVTPLWKGGRLIEAAKWHHDNLKELEILGYSGHKRNVGFVMNVIDSAVSLEKIVINPRKYRSYASAWYAEETEEEKKARNHAMEKLKPKVPSTIEFVCL